MTETNEQAPDRIAANLAVAVDAFLARFGWERADRESGTTGEFVMHVIARPTRRYSVPVHVDERTRVGLTRRGRERLAMHTDLLALRSLTVKHGTEGEHLSEDDVTALVYLADRFADRAIEARS